ncbi:MAG TPA: RES family NAD+ phosphorylase [Burkholderiaceae bacterium]|nr:RES family NAD+ phosphorylase [Burkholderiaceae bacterium]
MSPTKKSAATGASTTTKKTTAIASALPRLTDIAWAECFRLVPSRFPPVSLYERVASADEFDAVFAVEMLTNPRLRQEAGEISLVAPDERVFGLGSTPVMAAFCHLNAQGSRFSDGTWGAYYAAATLATAVAEVAYHREKFFEATKQAAIDVDLRVYVAALAKPLHDVRAPRWHAVHHPDDYGASQALARRLRLANSWGIVYRSVRDAGGECIAALRPKTITLPVRQAQHVTLRWNGMRIEQWYAKAGLHTVNRAQQS